MRRANYLSVREPWRISQTVLTTHAFRILGRKNYTVKVNHLLLHLLRCTLHHPSRLAGSCVHGTFLFSNALLLTLIYA